MLTLRLKLKKKNVGLTLYENVNISHKPSDVKSTSSYFTRTKIYFTRGRCA